MRKIKKIVHVNQHLIKLNNKQKSGPFRPIFTVKQSGKTTYATKVKILGPCELVYQPEDPLSCGAKAFIVTYADIELENPQTFAEVEKEIKI